MLSKYSQALKDNTLLKFSGRVSKIIGLMIESIGPAVEIGEVCDIFPIKSAMPLKGEVVGFNNDKVLIMPLGDMAGIGPGSRVVATGHALQVDVSEDLLGRILDGLGNPIDELGKPSVDRKYLASCLS